MARKVGTVLLLLHYLHLRGHVLWVRTAEVLTVGGFSKPVGAGFQLVVDVLVVVFLGLLLVEFLGVGRSAAEWELSSGVSVCGLDVLVATLVSWELGSI